MVHSLFDNGRVYKFIPLWLEKFQAKFSRLYYIFTGGTQTEEFRDSVCKPLELDALMLYHVSTLYCYGRFPYRCE